MELKGYKAFAVDGTNIVGRTFEEGHKYHMDGNISFGTSGNGFHMALNLEDTIRYAVDEFPGDCIIAEVIGSGTVVEGFDNYYGYYDMYSCSDLEIVKYLTREEIIEYGLNLNEIKMKRFVECYKLSEEEIILFEGKSFIVDLSLDYYQRNNKEAYSEENKRKRLSNR